MECFVSKFFMLVGWCGVEGGFGCRFEGEGEGEIVEGGGMIGRVGMG